MKKLQIGIIGPGSIGGVIAVKLASAGYNIELTKKKENELVIGNSVAMEISGQFGSVNYLVPSVSNNEFTTKKDIIFLCVRAYNVERCLRDAVSQLKPNGVIVAMQNVLTMDELIAGADIDQIVMMYIDWNSVRVSPHEMYVFAGGHNHIGAFSKKISKQLKLVQNIMNAVSPTHIEEDFPQFMLSRFILDNTILCMGALTGRSVGGFLSTKQGKNVFINLIKEQVAVIKKAGMEVAPYANVFDYEKFIESSISGVLYRKTMFNRLIFQNGNNVSSVLRRLENNKRTEIDWLIAKTVEKAELYEVSVPYSVVVNKMLHEIINHQRTICMENLLDEQFTKIKE